MDSPTSFNMFERPALLGAVTDGTCLRPQAEAFPALRISCLPARGRVMPTAEQNRPEGEMPAPSDGRMPAAVPTRVLRQACKGHPSDLLKKR
jgi:hypothetical protein